MDVIDITSFKLNKSELYACTDCGGFWFELKRDRGDDVIGMAMNRDGSVVAYAGVVCCIECGKRTDVETK